MYEKEFKYSQEWYSEVYHKKGDYHLPERTWADVQGEWDAKGHHERFMTFLERWGYNLNGKKCIDIGCHHAKSMAWALRKYARINWFSGFDFSRTAIEWCKKQFPDKYKGVVTFTQGNVSALDRTYARNSFDVSFCIDMIEHLPEDVYLKMVEGIKVITKPGGKIVCQVGKTDQPEHIHIIPDMQVISDFNLSCSYQDHEYFVMDMPE